MATTYIQQPANGFDVLYATDLGLVNDGVTVNTAAVIAAAMTTASAAQKPLFIPAGTYLLQQDGANAWCVDVPVSNLVVMGVTGQSVFKAKAGMPNSTVPLFRVNAKNNVTFRDLVFDGNWGNAVTAIDYASNLAVLPQATVNVVSTTGFPASGTFKVWHPVSGTQTITYTGLTATSFTGCSGGSGTLIRGSKVGYTDSQAGINHTTQLDPKNHAIMLRGANSVRIEDCTFQSIYGDCVWMGTPVSDDLWAWTRNVWITGCTMNLIARNAITFGAGVERVWVQDNVMDNVFTTCIDAEPQELFTAAREIHIARNYMDGWFNPELGYMILISCVGAYVIGQNQSSAARTWRIVDNVIKGGMQLSTCVDIVVRGNRIVTERTCNTSLVWAPIKVDHTAEDVLIEGNYIYDNQTASAVIGDPHMGAIHLTVYSSGNINLQPSSVTVRGNKIHVRKSVNGIFVNSTGGRSIGSTATAEYASTATSVTATTLTKTGAGWTVDQWIGWSVITGGSTALVESNTATVLTLRASTAVPPYNSTANAWRSPLGGDAPVPTAGAFTITNPSGLVDICDNHIDCGADGNTAGGYGMYVVNDRPNPRLSIRFNVIKNSTTWGLLVDGNTQPPQLVEIIGNKFWDDQAVATMSGAIRFTNVNAITSVVKLLMYDNSTIGGVATLLSLGGGASGTWLLRDGETQDWTGYLAPAMSAPNGSTYKRLDGGAATTFYVRESGAWAGK